MITQRVACLDMAGTTVSDGGAVMESFRAGLAAGGIGDGHPRFDEAVEYVHATMGQSKIEVFRSLFGDEAAAQTALAGFEATWDGLLSRGQVVALPGAAAAISALREGGVAVALVTGFSRSVRDAVLDTLGWRNVADLTLCPEDAGRGRPWPDMVLRAALDLGASAMSDVTVVGDTASDMESGVRAGAGIVAGVLSGTGNEAGLRSAGATHVLATIVDVVELLLGRDK